MDGSIMSGTTTYFGITYPTSTDLVKDGASNMQTIATGFDSAVAIPTYNNQTGTSYTFVLLDAAKVVTANNASASTYTIPPQSSVVWTTGATLRVTNLGAGVVTFAAGAGVTVTNTAQTLAQYQSANLVRTGSDAWTVLPESGGSSGLTLIKTQTIGTAVSSVNVTGAFSTTYDNYKIMVSGGASSNSSIALFMKLGATVTGYYSSNLYVAWAGTTSALTDNNGNQWSFAGGSPNANGLFMNIDLITPFTANSTRCTSNYTDAGGGGAVTGYLNNTTSYTDFTVTVGSGTLTGGTIRVYGYQKS